MALRSPSPTAALGRVIGLVKGNCQPIHLDLRLDSSSSSLSRRPGAGRFAATA